MDEVLTSSTQRRAVENAIGHHFYTFLLASLQDRHAQCSVPGGYLYPPEDGYECFQDRIRADKGAKKKRPATVMGGLKVILCAFFASIVSAAKAGGRGVPAVHPITHLVNNGGDRAAEVRFMSSVVTALQGTISVEGALARDFDSVEWFAGKIAAFVAGPGSKADVGDKALAQLYVHFLKCVAWMASCFVFGSKYTLNAGLVHGIIRSFGALPDVGSPEGVMKFLHDQSEWANAVAAEAAAAAGKPAPPKKAAAAPGTATTGAPAGGASPATAAAAPGTATAAPATAAAGALAGKPLPPGSVERPANAGSDGEPGYDAFDYSSLM